MQLSHCSNKVVYEIRELRREIELWKMNKIFFGWRRQPYKSKSLLRVSHCMKFQNIYEIFFQLKPFRSS